MVAGTHEIVIVGAGPAGLCAASAALRRGLRPLVIERSERIGGLWHRVAPDLRCLSPRHRDRLVDGSHPLGPGDRASAAEVLAALETFAEREGIEVQLETPATSLDPHGAELVLHTPRGELRTRRLILACGEYSRPWVPELPGHFAGAAVHSSCLQPETVQAGEQVVLVGSGASAVDLVPRLLARGAELTVCAQSPVQRPAPGPGPLTEALR